MIKLGMVGGVGPESTIDYYRRLIALYQQKVCAHDYPEMVIASINMTAMNQKIAQNDLAGLTDMLSGAVASLAAAGAKLVFMASNTPHLVFRELEKASPVPLVSILESTRQKAQSLGLKKVGLLGTLCTMQNRFYQDELDKGGIAAVVPLEAEQQYIQNKLFSEIELGIFLDGTRQELLNIVKRMIDQDGIDGVILGCTELPLILTADAFSIPFLNTSEIHIEQIFDRALAMSK